MHKRNYGLYARGTVHARQAMKALIAKALGHGRVGSDGTVEKIGTLKDSEREVLASSVPDTPTGRSPKR